MVTVQDAEKNALFTEKMLQAPPPPPGKTLEPPPQPLPPPPQSNPVNPAYPGGLVNVPEAVNTR
jgi:hypothetical protein